MLPYVQALYIEVYMCIIKHTCEASSSHSLNSITSSCKRPEHCFQRWKTPASFPDCVGNKTGNCIEFDPPEDRVDWCIEAQRRGTQCQTLTPTSQASSTRRKVDCPRHRKPRGPSDKKDDKGGTGGSSGGSLTSGAPSVKVGA
jgi:hypothetical protein